MYVSCEESNKEDDVYEYNGILLWNRYLPIDGLFKILY